LKSAVRTIAKEGSSVQIASAIEVLHSSQVHDGDRKYFEAHERRYSNCLQRVAELSKPGCRILDIGSHYLHQATLFKLLGYDILGLDVSAFQELAFVKDRASRFGLRTCSIDALGEGEFLRSLGEDQFDVVLFCEILEHVTFNPAAYWRRIYELLRPGGFIFMSTPNSLRWVNLISTIKRAVLLQGVGISVESVLSDVTYGHHWKEYSAREIVQYFKSLSPDFQVEVRPYAYRKRPSTAPRSAKAIVQTALCKLGNMSQFGAEELEVIVRLPAKRDWQARERSYGEE
jgi:2-polyprenyl-3-methyl-5-hydroxy-6-metoxy-1,4-benzoquinol methylase